MAEEKVGQADTEDDEEDDMYELAYKVGTHIKAILKTTEGGIAIYDLDRDFKTLSGYKIPFEKFGHRTLESFLEAQSYIATSRTLHGTLILLKTLREVDIPKPKELTERDKRLIKSMKKYASEHNVRPFCFPAYDPHPIGMKASDVDSTKIVKPKDGAPVTSPRVDRALHGDRGKYYSGFSQKKFEKRTPQWKPRSPSPAKSPESDWDADEKKGPTDSCNRNEAKPSVVCVDLPLQALKIEDTVPENTPGNVFEETEMQIKSDKTISQKALAFETKLPEKDQAELKKNYLKESADFADSLATIDEFTSGINFRELQQLMDASCMPHLEMKIERGSPKFTEISAHLFVFRNYPDTTVSLKESLETTAAEALLVFDKLNLPPEVDTAKPIHFINRILKLVYSRPSGFWRSYVARAYAEEYGEALPKYWAESFLCMVQDVAVTCVNQNSGDVLTEIWKPKLIGRAWQQPVGPIPAVAAPTASFLQYSQPWPQTQSRPLPRTRSLQLTRALLPSVLPPVNREQPKPIVSVEMLKLAPRKTYKMVVTGITAGCGIWARVSTGDYETKYIVLMKSLDEACTQNDQTLVPIVGGFYAAYVRSAWHRVMLISMQRGDIATVFLLDLGGEEKLPFRSCLPLAPEFSHLPGLAVKCVLEGFENFIRDGRYYDLLHRLVLNETVEADVISVVNGMASVYLTGTGLHATEINSHIAGQIGLSISQERNMTVGAVYLVQVPKVSDTGDVMVNVEDDARVLIALMCKQLERKLLKYNPIPVTDVKICTKIYFARLLHKDNSVYRVVALSEPTNNQMVCVKFIDQGDKLVIPLTNIFELDEFFEPLLQVLPQALVVMLAGIPPNKFSSKMAQRLGELAPYENYILMKVVVAGFVPQVELFYRSVPDNMMVSLNHVLLSDSSLSGPPMMPAEIAVINVNCLSTVLNQARLMGSSKRLTPFEPVMEYATIPPATIPPAGSMTDVNIPMAAGPTNFVVQPWNSYFLLQRLMCEVQEEYARTEAANAPLVSEVEVGRPFAALHPDGSWYRVVATSQVINSDSVLACFSDYGDIQVLQLSNMRHLAPRFCQLPCQAIRAKLYGIKPLHHDWSVQDCLAFQALVNERQFVSIVMSEPADIDDGRISLKLIDTSGSDDVHIDKLLVAEGRAEFVNNGI